MRFVFSSTKAIILVALTGCFLFLSTASADTLGQQEIFFIDPGFSADKEAVISATLRKISEHAYFYIENKYWESLTQNETDDVLDQLSSLAKEFDTKIYPIETAFFGSEPNPGADNDPRITILFSPLIENAGGYYNTGNYYKKNTNPASNEREMFYINTSALDNMQKLFTFLTHEFQHLITFNQKELLRDSEDDTWLNEMRSEYATHLLGYNDVYKGSNMERRVSGFLSDPYDSLTEWHNLPPDYGNIALFGLYIAEKYSPDVISDTLQNDLAGIKSI